jgi:hypothetical protein
MHINIVKQLAQAMPGMHAEIKKRQILIIWYGIFIFFCVKKKY